MTKIDPYKHKERFMKWKDKVKNGIPEVSQKNSDIIRAYIFDMENGINVSNGSKKGARSYIRLNTIKDKLMFFALRFKEVYKLDSIIEINEVQLCKFFTDMRNGEIKRKDGLNYVNVYDFVKDFKAFWHWHIKTNRKLGIEIKDISEDLDTHKEKPKWVYLNEEQVKKLTDQAKYEYKVLITFLYDSGIRSPTELMNIKVSDLHNDCKELNIRDEISKTFGRKIKLFMSSKMLKDFIEERDLKLTDYLFPISPPITNQYLRRLAKKLFGDKESLAGEKYSMFSMYDMRHCSCCYWLPRYKSENALMYRFGWKSSDKIHYYSEFLGMKDTVQEEDILIDVTKTEIEKRLLKSEQEREILQEKVKVMEEQMKEIQTLTLKLYSEMEKK